VIYNNVLLVVNDQQNIEKVGEWLNELALRSLEEPGCLRFELFHSETQPELYMLIEQWETQASLDAHREAAAFTEVYVPNVIPLVTRMPHLCKKLAPVEQLQ